MALLPSGLAGSGSEEEGASLTWTGGHAVGKRERERNITTGHLSITDREEEVPKGGTTASTYTVVIKSSWPNNRLWSAGTHASKSVLARI